MMSLGRRKFLGVQLGAFAAASVRGFAKDGETRESTEPQPNQPILRLHSWTGFIDPALLAKFEASAGCKVIHSFFASNEELFTAIDADAGAYDVITPSSYMTARLAREGKLRELDLGKSSMAGHDFLVSPLGSGTTRKAADCKHGLPFSWSVSGIATNSKNYKGQVDSWRLFEDPKLTKRFSLLDDMRELMGAALKVLGKSSNSVNRGDLAAAAEVVGTWVKHATKLDATDYCFGLVAGEHLVCHAYDGDVGLAAAGEPTLAFRVPKEGATVGVDELAICRDAARPDLATAFLEFISQPSNARQNSIWSNYGSLNLAALEKPEANAMRDRLEHCEVIEDLGEETGLWESCWQKIFEL